MFWSRKHGAKNMGDNRGKSHFLKSTLQRGSLTMLFHHMDPKHSLISREQCSMQNIPSDVLFLLSHAIIVCFLCLRTNIAWGNKVILNVWPYHFGSTLHVEVSYLCFCIKFYWIANDIRFNVCAQKTCLLLIDSELNWPQQG